MVHHRFHLRCCVKGSLASLLWLGAAVALVFAWKASFSPTGLFLKLPVAHLYWDALVLGVLALGLKRCGGAGLKQHDCESCATCAPEEKSDRARRKTEE